MARTFSNTQDLVNVEEIQKGAIVLQGGRLVKVLMVDGINFSLKSEEEQNLLTFGYQNFLNGLDFPIQIIIHSRRINIDKYISALDKRRAQEASALLQSQISEYEEFIKSFVKANPIMTKTFFVIVSFSPVGLPQTESFTKFLPFLKKKPDAKKKEELNKQEHFTHALAQLDQRVAHVVNGLTTVGLRAEALGDDALTELLYNFYNPESIERQDINLPEKTEEIPQE